MPPTPAPIIYTNGGQGGGENGLVARAARLQPHATLLICLSEIHRNAVLAGGDTDRSKIDARQKY